MKHPDIDNIGKRMPYTVPDGFFESAAARITARTERRRFFIPERVRMLAAAVAVTAVIASALIFATNHRQTSPADIDEAFCALSVDDQDFLLETYQDDIFLTIN